MTPEEFLKLKKKVTKLQEEYHKAEGARESLLERLKSFDCNTLEEAHEELESLKKQVTDLKAKHKRALNQFEKKWKKRLEEVDE